MHNRWSVGAFSIVTLITGCSGGDGSSNPDARADSSADSPGPDAGCPTTWAVDATTGSDSATGNCFAPFKTITHALSVATTGTSISVAPGSYSAASGETIPIAIPDGVALIGDETHKGLGPAATTITGHATVRSPSYYTTTLTLGSGATIAGFSIVNDDANTGDVRSQIWLYGETNGIVRNNTLNGSGYGVIFENGTTGTAVTDNTITGHSSAGLFFGGGGASSKVQNNVITGNLYGVEYDSVGGDLGGGATGSTGGNTISCSTGNDIWTNTAAITISAKTNKWDHQPPTSSSTSNSTSDIYNGQSVPLDTTGATVVAAPCT